MTWDRGVEAEGAASAVPGAVAEVSVALEEVGVEVSAGGAVVPVVDWADPVDGEVAEVGGRGDRRKPVKR